MAPALLRANSNGCMKNSSGTSLYNMLKEDDSLEREFKNEIHWMRAAARLQHTRNSIQKEKIVYYNEAALESHHIGLGTVDPQCCRAWPFEPFPLRDGTANAEGMPGLALKKEALCDSSRLYDSWNDWTGSMPAAIPTGEYEGIDWASFKDNKLRVGPRFQGHRGKTTLRDVQWYLQSICTTPKADYVCGDLCTSQASKEKELGIGELIAILGLLLESSTENEIHCNAPESLKASLFVFGLGTASILTARMCKQCNRIEIQQNAFHLLSNTHQVRECFIELYGWLMSAPAADERPCCVALPPSHLRPPLQSLWLDIYRKLATNVGQCSFRTEIIEAVQDIEDQYQLPKAKVIECLRFVDLEMHIIDLMHVEARGYVNGTFGEVDTSQHALNCILPGHLKGETQKRWQRQLEKAVRLARSNRGASRFGPHYSCKAGQDRITQAIVDHKLRTDAIEIWTVRMLKTICDDVAEKEDEERKCLESERLGREEEEHRIAKEAEEAAAAAETKEDDAEKENRAPVDPSMITDEAYVSGSSKDSSKESTSTKKTTPHH